MKFEVLMDSKKGIQIMSPILSNYSPASYRLGLIILLSSLLHAGVLLLFFNNKEESQNLKSYHFRPSEVEFTYPSTLESEIFEDQDPEDESEPKSIYQSHTTFESATKTNENLKTQSMSSSPHGLPETNLRSHLDLKAEFQNLPPQYPLIARQKGWEGTVGLIYQVQPDGQVTDVTISQSSGYEVLDQEAVRAISQFRYLPGQEGKTFHRITFMLK